MALGKKIRALREEKGWTLEQLSDASGVEVGTISALEVRDSQRTKFAGALAAALGVTLESLVGDVETTAAAPKAPRRNDDPVWPFTATFADFEKLRPADRRILDKTLTTFIAGTLARYESEEMKRDSTAIHRNESRASSATMALLNESIEAMEEVAQGSQGHGHARSARKKGRVSR